MMAPENEDLQSDDDVPWLRDMVDDDLLPLFDEDESTQRRAVKHLIRLAKEDSDLESRLIDLLDESSSTTMTTRRRRSSRPSSWERSDPYAAWAF
ncbi:MAG TPA: hypothetical protein VFD71_12730 [Planctomycetota bacterium]|nr:hypothetical protein [Planctomycetota bacterium]